LSAGKNKSYVDSSVYLVLLIIGEEICSGRELRLSRSFRLDGEIFTLPNPL
jgi:hypothetical protein